MTYRLVLVLFLVSGALGLGYQVLWSKYLLDFVGVSAYSYATVLAAFMAGLALGSALLGRLADRAASPLRLYAYLEAGVGVYALLYGSLAAGVASLYGRWVSFAPDEAGGGHGLWAKALASALLLLVPTTLMGGTYPALLRHATARMGLVGRKASQLYAANAAGAVLGALLMAFVLMPGLGMRRSLVLLAGANGLVALAAFLLAGRAPLAPLAPAPEPVSEPAVGSDVSPLGERETRNVLLLILAEGFLAFALEIAWTRYFGIVLGSSTYSFAIMLAAFITGIALGSAWLSRAEASIREPLRFFGWTQVLAGLAVLVPLPFYPYVPWLFLNYGTLFSMQPAAFFLNEAGKLLACYIIMLPPTILIGMALPLVVKGISRDLAGVGRDAGRVYAWNTWGNVAGALLAGLVLLPALGMELLLRAAALGSVALGVVAIVLHAPAGTAKLGKLTVAGAAVLVWSLWAGSWAREWFVISPVRREPEAISLRDAKRLVAINTMHLFEDDAAAHLMVYSAKIPGSATPEVIKLSVNGKTDATSEIDMPTQVLLAQVPLLLAPQPRDVLVVGLASGVTSGAALSHPIRRLDVVEIVGAMPKATRFFEAWNDNPFGDRRFRLIVDDARSYLSYTRQRYDVIVSEPSNPWMAGTGALFSKDFYAQAARTLQPDGVYVQWLQAYEMSDETFAAVVRTFRSVFPYVYGFQGSARDLLLVGSRKPLDPDWPAVEARFASLSVRAHLARVGIVDVAGLLAFQVLSPTTVDYIAAQTDLENTDDNHLLEYRAPRELFSVATVSLVPRLDERLHAGPALLWSRYPRQRREALLPTVRPLSDGRVRSEAVVSAFQLAAYHLDPDAVLKAPDGAALFAGLLSSDPPGPTAIADRLGVLLASGRGPQAARLLDPYAPALLLEAALSPEQAAFWIRRSEQWPGPPQARPARLREFRVELLMAVGQAETAARELAGWIDEPQGPRGEWAVQRACEVDPGSFCTAVVGRLAEGSRAPFPRRLLALRREVFPSASLREPSPSAAGAGSKD